MNKLTPRLGMKIRARLVSASMPFRTGRITNCRPIADNPAIVTIKCCGTYCNVYFGTKVEEIPTTSIKGMNYKAFAAAFSRVGGDDGETFTSRASKEWFLENLWEQLCDFHGV